MGATAAFQTSASNADVLTYLLTGDGAATTTTAITCTGAVTPDLVTDIATLAAAGVPNTGPMRSVVRCRQDGLGSVVAVGAALTQAQARALFNSDGTIGNATTPKLELRFQPRSGVAAWSVDINVAAGAPIVEVSTSAAAGTALLRLKVHNPLR